MLMARSDSTEGGRGPGTGPGMGAGSTVHIAVGTKQLDVVRKHHQDTDQVRKKGKMGPQPIVQFPVPGPVPIPGTVWTVQHNI